MAARGEAQADVEVSTLVVPAWRLRWRAPELALVLGERAVSLASTRRDEIDRLRAESLVVFASNRMGRGVRIADRALDALRAAESAAEHETAWRLRVELAACATAVGAPLTGFGAVRPVLAAEGVPNALRAAALVQASDCLVTIGRGPQLGMALSEADQLYVADPLLDDDTRLLQRGLLHASAAAQHRRWGDLQAATDAASKGLELLAKLADPSVDSGQVRAKLTLELVCALMDSNRQGEASEIGSPLLDLPVRAPSAADVGWLRLALATRVHLPAGRVDIARGMLQDTADSAQRHQLDILLAESLLALAHVHEVSGELAEALNDLRSAHAAERRRARAVYAVRARLAAEFSGAHRQPVGPHDQLGSLLRPGDGRTASAQGAMRGSQPPADAVLAPELKQQLRQWRPIQVPKSEGLRVKRTLRAAEDMTMEGISAARAHAADRWRLVQPFGTDDQPTSAEAPTAGGRRRAEDRPATADAAATSSAAFDETADPTSDRTVAAAGLIAAAGAMRSGRRRAAREAAEEDSTGLPMSALERTSPSAPDPSPEASDAEPEVANVMDTLKAQGLLNKRRAGGRRRAPDAEGDGTTTPTDQSAAGPAYLTGPAGATAADFTTPDTSFADRATPPRAQNPASAHPTGSADRSGTDYGIGAADSDFSRGSTGGSDFGSPTASTDSAGSAFLTGVAGASGADFGAPGGADSAHADPAFLAGPGGVDFGRTPGSGDSAGPADLTGPGGAGVADFGTPSASADSAAGAGSAYLADAGGSARHSDSAGAAYSGGAAGAGDPTGSDMPARGAGEPGNDSGLSVGSASAAYLASSAGRGGSAGAGESDSANPAYFAMSGDQTGPGGSTTSRGDESTTPGDPASVTFADIAAANRSEQPAEEDTGEQAPASDAPKWRVEPPSRLRGEEEPPQAPPADLFDAPTMVQPIVGLDGMPVERPGSGLGAAFAKGPLIPTARVPDPGPLTDPEPPSEDPPGPLKRPRPDTEPDPIPLVPEPDQIPSIPDPDAAPKLPSSGFGFDLGRSRFLSSADVEEDDDPEPPPPHVLPEPVKAEEPEPVADEPVDPFVTAVVVGDRTIEVPSAARASRRHKSDLSLAELLTEALVAYETGRRSDPDADAAAEDEIADWISSADTPADKPARASHHAAEPAPETSDAESTTPIIPVGDPESTGPIWLPGPDGKQRPRFGTWTLPES